LILKHLFLLFSFSLFAQLFAQSEKDYETVEVVKPDVFNDTLKKVPWSDQYREDQFYVGISYNILQNKPSGFSQNSFSSGFTFGFLRDMPINATRTFAIAPGLGFSYQNYHQN
jgi:hypothetical protein